MQATIASLLLIIKRKLKILIMSKRQNQEILNTLAKAVSCIGVEQHSPDSSSMACESVE